MEVAQTISQSGLYVAVSGHVVTNSSILRSSDHTNLIYSSWMTFQELSVTSRGHSFGDSLTVKHTTPIYS